MVHWRRKWQYSCHKNVIDSMKRQKDVTPEGERNAKVGNQEIPGVTGKFGLGVQNEAQQRLTEFCQENTLVIANTLFQQPKRRLYTDIIRWSILKLGGSDAKDGEALHSQQKQDLELTMAQIVSASLQNSGSN
ncbi:craniofacial development protein 2-like [Capricornis sumatraensis]|uniref:craniofacial development protein 2-like n=1 Tax=Capricornis sumatraensis TaxID=34865 RepID=UPI003604C44F